MKQVIEVIKRGRRGTDGASGVISTLRTSDNVTLAVQNRGYAVIADDDVTVTLPAASVVGEGWSCSVLAVGGEVTLSSASDIDGSAGDYVMPEGSAAQILTDGNEYLIQFYLASNVATVGTNAVTNESSVTGASASAALNALLALLGAWGGTGSSPLLANLDATGTAANLYRFDATTTGTRPGAWVSDDDGVILILRQTATQALEIGKSNGVAGIFYREMDTTWGAWERLDVPAQDQAAWNAGTSTVESTITAAKLRALMPSVAGTTKTDTFSTTSTSYVAITGLTAAITPKTTASRVKVTVTLNVSSSENQPWLFQLTRNGSEIAIGDTAGSRSRITAEIRVDESGTFAGNEMVTVSFTFLDSPASTSAQTYGVNVAGVNRSGGIGTFYLNRTHIDTDASDYSRAASSIIVEEVL